MAVKNIVVPDIGGASDVDVIEVLVKAGDTIKIDTSLVTLESDKATMEVPSSDEGIVKEVKIKAGDKVSQGSVILVLETAAAEKAAPEKAAVIEEPAASKEQSTDEPSSAATAQVGTVIPAEHNNADVHAGPAVRKLAREFGVSLAEINGTGPKHRILKEDVQAYVKSRLAMPVAAGASMGLPQAPSVDFSKFGPVSLQPLTRLKKISGKIYIAIGY